VRWTRGSANKEKSSFRASERRLLIIDRIGKGMRRRVEMLLQLKEDSASPWPEYGNESYILDRISSTLLKHSMRLPVSGFSPGKSE
jgi:hypothetical protein